MGRRRFSSAPGRALIASAAVVVLGGAGWLWGRHGSERVAVRETAAVGTPLGVDRPAPAFTQPLLTELGSLSLARYEGKVVVLNFWASWCAACGSETPELERLWRSYGRRGAQVVGVDYEDRRSAAITFARSHGMRYPSVLDPNGTVGDAYAVIGLPTTYLIAPNGHIRYVVDGKLSVASFRVALESLLPRTVPKAAGG